jgi:hypothetical protein
MSAIYFLTIAAATLPVMCLLSNLILRIDFLWLGEVYL